MDAALAWLDRHGAGDVAHRGGTLRGHLVRVADRLAAWGLSDVVRLAGLTHAAYGTAGFEDHLITPAQRDDLRAAIGAEAEALVYTYGACDRSTSYPQFPGGEPVRLSDRFTGDEMRLGDAETRAFVALTVANEIDVMQHNAGLAARHGSSFRALAHESAHWLPATALRDLDLLTGGTPTGRG